jgi:sulfate adenylyltransferase
LNADATPALPGELRDLPTLTPGPAELADLELLLSGAFPPITGFMRSVDAAATQATGRLADGTPWPAPVVLAAPEGLARAAAASLATSAAADQAHATSPPTGQVTAHPTPPATTPADLPPADSPNATSPPTGPATAHPTSPPPTSANPRPADSANAAPPVPAPLPAGTGFRLILSDPEGVPVALMDVTEVWREPAPASEPALNPLRSWAATPWRLAGQVRALRALEHGPFARLRRTPAQVRAEFDTSRPVLAVATRTALHRRHLGQLRQVAEKLDARVLVLALLSSSGGEPVGRPSRPSGASPDAQSLVRALLAARKDLPADALTVAVPLAERDDLRSDLLMTAHVAAAYGARYLLDITSTPGTAAGTGVPIEILSPEPWAYDTDVEVWRPATKIEPDHARADLTDAELAEILDNDDPIPAWFTPSAVAAELRRAHPARHVRGLTVFFTGLSGSGKSTIARGVADALVERGGRTVTLLDGDVVRRLLSAGLTFSRDDRDLNIRRIGYVAAEITRHGGVAICAPIAPYAATRAEVRRMVGEVGDFVLIHVATPLAECERRDRKGLYAKARAGLIPEFTGISDPYEEPADADLRIDTTGSTPENAVNEVLNLLAAGGWARGSDAF